MDNLAAVAGCQIFGPLSLPDELWAKILLQVENEFWDNGRLESDFHNFRSMIDAQLQFLQLRLVCHRFNEVFKHSGLSRGLLLPPFLIRKQALPSLLTWLEQYGASLERFAALCNPGITPYFETVLRKLMPPQTMLGRMFLTGWCSSSSVQLMSGLTSLTCCKIRNNWDAIDLTPLKELANIQELHLTGQFFAVVLPAHLTNLVLSDASLSASGVGWSNSCVTSLRRLEMSKAYISGLHPCGLLACTALEELECRRCWITADAQEYHFDISDDSAICMPAGISALTSLSQLVLATRQDAELFDLAPLHALSLLQDLHVVSEAARLQCSAGLSRLQKLTSLSLVGPDERSNDDHPSINLAVDWSSMHALRRLTLHHLSIECTSSIVQLTALHNLSEIEIFNSGPVQSSVKFFSLLVYRLARYCPQVKLAVDQEIFG